MAYEPTDYDKPVAKIRNCLRCGKGFESTGSGNRICPGCATHNKQVVSNYSPRMLGATNHRLVSSSPTTMKDF